MDFEIEGDDDYDFESDWKKPKKGNSYFGGAGLETTEEDPYDFDFGAVKKPSKTSFSPQAQRDTNKSYSSKEPIHAVSKSTNALDRSDNALAKAQSMLDKYASKPQKQISKPKTLYNYDEDDISIDSDNEDDKKPVKNYNKTSGAKFDYKNKVFFDF
jgi:hypothetical protein